jgi:hypothetical protein
MTRLPHNAMPREATVNFNEYVGNVHLHTNCSDGTATHEEIARIAQSEGLDFVIPTDHNVLAKGKEGWYGHTLLLVGEEVHDTQRVPEANHYLAFDISKDVAPYAKAPQAVIDAVNSQGGFGFIAHPFEHSAPLVNEAALPWVDWTVTGYTGLEIWNYMSEFKAHLPNMLRAVLLAYFPQTVMKGPFPETLARWDELLRTRKVVAICGSDAHATTYRLGPLVREVFSYKYLFRASNLHILTEEVFSRQLDHDKKVIYEALREGHCFTAYDLLGDARGFLFTARSGAAEAIMGDEITLQSQILFEVSSPHWAHIRLLRDGTIVARTRGKKLHYTAREQGVYRVEAYRRYLFRKRGWVFTNPIYVRAPNSS